MPVFTDVNPFVKENLEELIVDETVINVSLEMIFSTPYKNRPFRRNFGTVIHELLFEPLSEITASRIANEFKDAVAKWEPRIENVTISIVPNYIDQEYFVSISYTIPKLNNLAANYTFNVSRST